jgi:hypothetical protein
MRPRSACSARTPSRVLQALVHRHAGVGRTLVFMPMHERHRGLGWRAAWSVVASVLAWAGKAPGRPFVANRKRTASVAGCGPVLAGRQAIGRRFD